MKRHFIFSLSLIALPWTIGKGENLPVLVFEPVSITVTKFERNTFGAGVNPLKFSMGSVSGLELVVKVTPDPSLKLHPVASECLLSSFKDDKGTNLLGFDKAKQDAFWANNRPLTISQPQDASFFGIELRSPNRPAPDATRLAAEGTLVFALPDAGKEALHEALELESGKIVRVGPVQLKFTPTRNMFPPRPPKDSGEPREPSKVQPADSGAWHVQMASDPGIFNVSLLVFGADKDVPVLNTAQGSSTYTSKASGGKLGDEDLFKRASFYYFPCPAAKISRIRVRYFTSDSLIKVPFKLETGIGLGGGGNSGLPRN